jgi:uncharacterized membrane protein
METPTRTLIKSLTWQISGLIVMTMVTWFVTGSLVDGGAIAVSGALIGFFSYMVHERLWSRVRWGLKR